MEKAYLTLTSLNTLLENSDTVNINLRNAENKTIANYFNHSNASERGLNYHIREYLSCKVVEIAVRDAKNLIVKIDDSRAKYRAISRKWETMSEALEENDIETSNRLLCEIEKLLPFESEEEHEAWLYVAETYNDFDKFETDTVNIAKRLLY